MGEPTIRDRIKVVQAQSILDKPTPPIVRENLMLLAGLYGAVLDEHREADIALAVVTVGYVDAGDAVNRAELRAKVTREYARAREAKDTETLVLEMIRCGKEYLRSLDTEMKMLSV